MDPMSRFNCFIFQTRKFRPCKFPAKKYYYMISKDTVFVSFRFLNLFESFPAFICASNVESLDTNLFGVRIFNPFLYFTY